MNAVWQRVPWLTALPNCTSTLTAQVQGQASGLHGVHDPAARGVGTARTPRYLQQDRAGCHLLGMQACMGQRSAKQLP